MVDDIVNKSQALLTILSNAIGLKNVVNKFDYKINRFIRENKIGDSDFPFLLHHFLRLNYPINKITFSTPKRRLREQSSLKKIQ